MSCAGGPSATDILEGTDALIKRQVGEEAEGVGVYAPGGSFACTVSLVSIHPKSVLSSTNSSSLTSPLPSRPLPSRSPLIPSTHISHPPPNPQTNPKKKPTMSAYQDHSSPSFHTHPCTYHHHSKSPASSTCPHHFPSVRKIPIVRA